MTKKKKQLPAIAAIYARYSSSAQNDASIEQQVAECEAYARENGFRIVSTFADRAMSGRSDHRPEFQKMLRAAERREFQVVIAYKSNRISRNMLHALSYEEKLSKYGVSIVYCKEEFGNNAAGRFALRTMMNINQFYSENLSEDIMRGMMDNAQQCRVNGPLPLGYRRGADGRYEIDPETAPIVQEIFRRIAEGESKARVADDLNARQIKTGRGGEWNKNSFHSMLRNERYIGVYIYKDARIPGGVPAIIDDELFERARAMDTLVRTTIISRRRHDRMEYLLTGKLFCGYCREPMTGAGGTSKSGKVHYYYRCRNNAEKHTCQKKPVRKDAIERAVIDALRACVTKPENIEWMTDLVMKYRDRIIAESELGYLESRLAEIKSAIRNLMKAIEAGIITETTKARLDELEKEQKETLTGILMEKRAIPDVTSEHVRFYFEQFRSGDVDDIEYQKSLIDHFLKAVYLYDDHLKLVFSYADTDEGIDIPLDNIPDTTDPTETKSVLIPASMGHHTLLIRTPATLRMVGRVFLLCVWFDQE